MTLTLKPGTLYRLKPGYQLDLYVGSWVIEETWTEDKEHIEWWSPVRVLILEVLENRPYPIADQVYLCLIGGFPDAKPNFIFSEVWIEHKAVEECIR